MIFLSKENNKEVRIKVRLSEEENEKLKRCAAACGLSQSAFIRQLCKGKAPKPLPQKEFWEVLDALYAVHNSFKSCAKFDPSALEICKEIECPILELQETKTGAPQSLLCGEKEYPRNGELSALAAEAMNGV